MLQAHAPKELTDRLSAWLNNGEQILLSAQSAIDLQGRFRPHWLLVTDRRLLVVAGGLDGQGPQLARAVPREQIQDARLFNTVGSGFLQVKLDGTFIDLIRFGNEARFAFETLVRKLGAWRQGEPVELHESDLQDPRKCPTCGLTLQFIGDVCPRCVDRGAVFMRVLGLMKPYAGLALLMLVLLLAGIGLDLVPPKLTQYLVDHVLIRPEGMPPVTLAHRHALLVVLVGAFAATLALRTVLNMGLGGLSTRIGTEMTFDIRRRLVHKLQQMSVGYYDKHQVGVLMGRVTYDSQALQGFITQVTQGFVFQILKLIGVGLMLFWLSPSLAFFALIPTPLVLLGMVIFWRYVYPRYYRYWDSTSKLSGALNSMLSGIRVIKAFAQEDREARRFGRTNQYLRDSLRRVQYSAAVFSPTMQFVFQLGGVIVWYAGGRKILQGVDDFTIGKLMAFLGYLGMFYAPMAQLTQFGTWLTSFMTATQRIFEILDTTPQITEPRKPVRVPERVRGRIEFDHVTFGYERQTPIIKDVSFVVEPGEMIGIVGRSGSGKSTLINLLCRFYDVDEGAVRIDGIDVRDFDTDSLHRQIALVLQEPFLFRGSIRENIAFGRPQAGFEEILAAAKAAYAHDFIIRMPMGYDTRLGERGAGLSGGEKQRVAIARAVLYDAPILVLDEATSSVDTESEREIQRAMNSVRAGRTTIVIAHRLSTLRDADRILVIDDGRLVEQGTHEELMELGGLYHRLVKIQTELSGAKTMTIDRLVLEAHQRP